MGPRTGASRSTTSRRSRIEPASFKSAATGCLYRAALAFVSPFRYVRRFRMSEPDSIVVKGAREHNLKNVSLEIPKKKLVVFTGVSGSGKSSLAFDTLYAEGQRRYVESLSAYARQFLGQMEKPHYDVIRGLSPTISIEPKP